jgi:hypothetical protein
MALEKWLDEQIDANHPITKAVDQLYSEGQSLAFAGVLVSIGKRHPEKLVDDLKPLLFLREIYLFDLQAVNENLGLSPWATDGTVVNELRLEWSKLPGRRRHLKDLCCEWLVTRHDIETILAEVCATWREQAEQLPPDESEERVQILRWASDFDKSTWRQVTLPDGQIGWQIERPQELQDQRALQEAQLTQELMLVPHQCIKLIEARLSLKDEQLEQIWQRLQNWGPYEQLAAAAPHENQHFAFVADHRSARSALLAVLLCLGKNWLLKNPDRRHSVEAEVRELLSAPSEVVAFSEEDMACRAMTTGELSGSVS